MSSEGSAVPSAADIITYVGVPLTVISLLPLAYNAVITLIHWHKIKRQLVRNDPSAKLHADIFNRIVEVKFPKYLIRSPRPELDVYTVEEYAISLDSDNFDSIPLSSGENLEPPTKRSELAGGSWTFLKWDRHKLHTKIQRTQPGDTLRQPQAKIRFWDLISRLYELGARPDAKGWSELHTRSVWARNCHLMTVNRSDPLGAASLVLRVASPGHSDGPISLELGETGPMVDWSSLQRNEQGPFSPGSITLPFPAHRGCKKKEADEQTAGTEAIVCRISELGLISVSKNPATHDTFSIKHLHIRDDHECQGVWFASCATALHVQSQTPILDYRVPANIRQLVKVDIVPDGVVKLLYGGVREEIPTMVTTKYLSDRKQYHKERYRREHLQQTPPMKPPKADDAQREMEIRNKIRIKDDAYIDRVEQSLSTPTMESLKLQEASIDWLHTQGNFPGFTSSEKSTKSILSRMVTDQEFCKSLCQMLEHWKDWAERGTLSVDDFCIINHAKATFAQAALVIATLSGLENGAAAALVSMQECAAKWEYVELG